jgi:hypothetical protein
MIWPKYEQGGYQMRICATVMAVGLCLTLHGTVARSDTDECRDALDRYNSALQDVSSALRRYRSCVTDSKGHDDCAVEFSSLRSAQDDFESAVADYQSDCS